MPLNKIFKLNRIFPCHKTVFHKSLNFEMIKMVNEEKTIDDWSEWKLVFSLVNQLYRVIRLY